MPNTPNSLIMGNGIPIISIPNFNINMDNDLYLSDTDSDIE